MLESRLIKYIYRKKESFNPLTTLSNIAKQCMLIYNSLSSYFRYNLRCFDLIAQSTSNSILYLNVLLLNMTNFMLIFRNPNLGRQFRETHFRRTPPLEHRHNHGAYELNNIQTNSGPSDAFATYHNNAMHPDESHALKLYPNYNGRR
jgi:hypothetical protein